MPFYDPETMEQKLAGASYSTSEGVWVDGERKTVGAGGIIHIPANSLHSMVATDDEDVIFIVAKDTAWQIEGVVEDDSAYGAYIGEGADATVAARFRDIAEQGSE